MSTNPDDRLGELSPPERDFALRRMPVQTLAEAYVEACVVPAPVGEVEIRDSKSVIRDAVIELRMLGLSLRRGGNEAHAVELFRIVDDIREALK